MANIVVSSIFYAIFFTAILFLFERFFLSKKVKKCISKESEAISDYTHSFFSSIVEGGLAATAISVGIAYYYINLLLTLEVHKPQIVKQMSGIAGLFVIIADITAFATLMAAVYLLSAATSEKISGTKKLIMWMILFALVLAITFTSIFTLIVISQMGFLVSLI